MIQMSRREFVAGAAALAAGVVVGPGEERSDDCDEISLEWRLSEGVVTFGPLRFQKRLDRETGCPVVWCQDRLMEIRDVHASSEGAVSRIACTVSDKQSGLEIRFHRTPPEVPHPPNFVRISDDGPAYRFEYFYRVYAITQDNVGFGNVPDVGSFGYGNPANA